jgi:penicillin-binding protein 1C
VAVIWMGNAGGRGSGALVGAEAAAPVALQLLAAIDAGTVVAPAPDTLVTAAPVTHPRPRVSIVAPTPRTTILLDPEADVSLQRVQLRASAAGGRESSELFWFIDGAPLGSARGDEPLWWSPTVGPHEVRVVDALGDADRVSVEVARP